MLSDRRYRHQKVFSPNSVYNVKFWLNRPGFSRAWCPAKPFHPSNYNRTIWNTWLNSACSILHHFGSPKHTRLYSVNFEKIQDVERFQNVGIMRMLLTRILLTWFPIAQLHTDPTMYWPLTLTITSHNTIVLKKGLDKKNQVSQFFPS